ncbi:MAG: DUF2207 domain-containing protein, partial [Acidimicrobiia bacterium]|nr:DUF2207 domain-containing protein [Acidimicrobiia bacterium]
MRWRILGVTALLVAVFIPAVPAQAKSFDLPEADVRVDIGPDGSLVITERISFAFDGNFSGAFRDIPLRAGESLTGVTVSEGEQRYQSGGCVELGCSSPPGTFGARDIGDRVRIVWHYSAFNETRTFTIRYTVTGVAKAYDDVVDVNWKVWGEEWEVDLVSLTASMALPGQAAEQDVRVWGHPASVRGTVDLGPDGVSPRLEASLVPAGQFTEMRVVFPRSILSSTAGATVIEGAGLQDILAEEQREAERQERIQALVDRLATIVPILAVAPATLLGLIIYFLFGR